MRIHSVSTGTLHFNAMCQFGSDSAQYEFCFRGHGCRAGGCTCVSGGVGPCKYEGQSTISEFGQKCVKGATACVDATERPERTPSTVEDWNTNTIARGCALDNQPTWDGGFCYVNISDASKNEYLPNCTYDHISTEKCACGRRDYPYF